MQEQFFIQLTTSHGQKVSYNISEISGFADRIIKLKSGENVVVVEESYEKIKQLVTLAGVPVIS